jgi:hypothetical protein
VIECPFDEPPPELGTFPRIVTLFRVGCTYNEARELLSISISSESNDETFVCGSAYLCSDGGFSFDDFLIRSASSLDQWLSAGNIVPSLTSPLPARLDLIWFHVKMILKLSQS